MFLPHTIPLLYPYFAITTTIVFKTSFRKRFKRTSANSFFNKKCILKAYAIPLCSLGAAHFCILKRIVHHMCSGLLMVAGKMLSKHKQWILLGWTRGFFPISESLMTSSIVLSTSRCSTKKYSVEFNIIIGNVCNI